MSATHSKVSLYFIGCGRRYGNSADRWAGTQGVLIQAAMNARVLLDVVDIKQAKWAAGEREMKFYVVVNRSNLADFTVIAAG